MLQTYKAVLRGNHLEWSGDAPKNLEGEQAFEVHVTILKETNAAAQGKRMAEALEKLAAINALPEISDPPTWQREQRQDRPLPDRDA